MNDEIVIVIPMAGRGRPFVEEGFPFPKTLVEIFGLPMIELVVNSIRPRQRHKFVFVINERDAVEFSLEDTLGLIAPGCSIVRSLGQTAGALCSVLLAIEHISPNCPLIVANADQLVDADFSDFISNAIEGLWDGYIMTFPSTHPKWSYVLEENGRVIATAEKKPISNQATVGYYYFRSGSLFLSAAERALTKSALVGIEFYVCPVYNEIILDGGLVGTMQIGRSQMHSLGTPDDLRQLVANCGISADGKRIEEYQGKKTQC